ncbi:MAG: hypothetical protein HKL90_10280 [Elusimicrobia bacterium]|nr:hypothetical protein [Elusimicrobiota bacterium]
MASAQILCTKCGAASAAPLAVCAKCGGRNALVCGSCGTQNSLGKNFCDKCGTPLSASGSVAPPPVRPPGAGAPDIPATAVFRLPTPGQALASPLAGTAPMASSGVPLALPGASLPPAKQALPPSAPTPTAATVGDLWNPAAPPARATPSAPPSARERWAPLINGAAIVMGVALAVFAAWRWQLSQRPEVQVPRLATKYLDALRAQNYDAAYAMFSDEARRSCTLDEFRAIRDTTTWSWSGLRIEHQEPGAILFAYDLQTPGSPDRTDHVLFTQEGERWTRPYNWVLMRKVEESFDRGDADRGLLLAQAAATVNPRDPMAWGYLCEAAYYRKSPTDAETRCVRALELAQIYPSDLTPKSLYHLHAILADTYTQALARPDKAVEQFSLMLGFPNISPEDQCQILLARAQAYRQLSRPGEALNDVTRGAALCTNPSDLAFIQKMRDALRAPVP